MKWTAEEIELCITNFKNIEQNYFIPNVYTGFFRRKEADLLIITKAGYCSEVEIKISIQDFRNDFKKRYVRFDLFDFDERLKSKIYAMPKYLYKKHKEEIDETLPDYAGLWVATRRQYYAYGRIIEIKKPPVKKNCRKLTNDEIHKLLRLAHFRLWNIKSNLFVNNLHNKSESDPFSPSGETMGISESEG